MPEQAPFSSIPVAPNLLHYFVPDPLGWVPLTRSDCPQVGPSYALSTKE
jgi:hypothetical protein